MNKTPEWIHQNKYKAAMWHIGNYPFPRRLTWLEGHVKPICKGMPIMTIIRQPEPPDCKTTILFTKIPAVSLPRGFAADKVDLPIRSRPPLLYQCGLRTIMFAPDSRAGSISFWEVSARIRQGWRGCLKRYSGDQLIVSIVSFAKMIFTVGRRKQLVKQL